jgi:hypothetical protein
MQTYQFQIDGVRLERDGLAVASVVHVVHTRRRSLKESTIRRLLKLVERVRV